MKFNFIVILFNIILLLFFAVLGFLPYYILGPSFSSSFWRMNWPFVLVWAFLFFAFNIFYFINRKLLLLLEREDWPALVRFLEDKVIMQGRYSPRLVRLLANSYLVLSDSAAVMSLENKVAIAKPALVDENTLVFGTARILGNDISGALRFFRIRKDKVKSKLSEWVNWYYGFTLLLDRQFEESLEVFSLLARISRDSIVTALSSYFLFKNIIFVPLEKKREFRESSTFGRGRALKTLPNIKAWHRKTARLSAEIHGAVVWKYLEDAGTWLYREE